MRVLATPEVRQYLKELSQILYANDYFSYLDYAERYVEELFHDITTYLPTRLHRAAPPHFDRYGRGMYYASFRRNHDTVWYVFFTKYNDNGLTVYLVRHIENNHTAARYM